MSVIWLTAWRTVKALGRRFSTAMVAGVFIAVCAVRFALAMDSEAASNNLILTWALETAQLLPVMVALLAMDVWSEERRTGNMDFLLSVPVSERDLAIGKAFGVWLLSVLTIGLSFVVSMGVLVYCQPRSLAITWSLDSLAAVVALCAQAVPWVAISTMVSAWFMRGAASAAVAMAITAILPRKIWLAAIRWFGTTQTAFGEYPPDAQIVDLISGSVFLETLIGYAGLTIAALFITAQSVKALRFAGRAWWKSRGVVLIASLLSLSVAVSITVLVGRFGVELKLPTSSATQLSEDTRMMLSEADGAITARCFLSRSSADFHRIARLFRTFQAKVAEQGTLQLTIGYVDPRWDVGQAALMVCQEIPESSVVFMNGHRRVIVPAAELDERAMAMAIRRITSSPKRNEVYWTHGHGELAFDDYGAWGMSDIARELTREGYVNRRLDLTVDSVIPRDCAFIIVAAAKESFSSAELGRIAAYLKSGGRMLILDIAPGKSGVDSLLPSLGVLPVSRTLASARSITGTDVIVSEFAKHPITERMAGSTIVLERPLAYDVSSVAASSGIDSLEFTALAKVGSSPVAVAVERGARAGGDVAIRPMRIAIVGDGTFVVNSLLTSRANANRNFFMNMADYLAGTELQARGGLRPVIVPTMEQRDKRCQLILGGVIAPLIALLVWGLMIVRWRSNR